MSYQGFGKASGPSAPPKLQHSFGNSAIPDSVSSLRDSRLSFLLLLPFFYLTELICFQMAYYCFVEGCPSNESSPNHPSFLLCNNMVLFIVI